MNYGSDNGMGDKHVVGSTVSWLAAISHSPEVIFRGVRVSCVRAYTVNNEEIIESTSCICIFPCPELLDRSTTVGVHFFFQGLLAQ